MANDRPGSRWQPHLPVVPKRVVGRRRIVALPKPNLGVLRDLKRPGLRDLARSLSPRSKRATICVGGVLVLATVAWFLYQSPPLSVQSVDVRGASVLSADLIRDTAAVDDDSLTRPDLEGARRRILAMPMVKDAQVERDWPFGIDITIVERAPFAVWRAGGQHYVIDSDGVVLDVPSPNTGVVIVQTGAAGPLEPGDRVGKGSVSVAARLWMTSQQTLGRSVVKLQYSEMDGLTVVLSGESPGETVRVLFGHPRDYDFKVAALYAILRRAAGGGRSVRSVDLRYGQKVAVQWG